MRKPMLMGILVASISSGAFAAETASTAQREPTGEASVTTSIPETVSAPVKSDAATARDNFCLFSGRPPSDVGYTVVRSLKMGKGSYGGVTEILPRLVDEALRHGADAIIDYSGSQRFGFWPWRMVRPVVRGQAVKWTEPPKLDCAAMGGAPLRTILLTNKAPD